MSSTIAHSSVRSRWQILAAAPHRPMFLLGALQLVLVMLFWLAELAGRAGFLLAEPLPLTLYATWAHAGLMVYGLFTLFIYGFLFTAFPRWIGGGAIAPRRYLTVALLAALGLALIYAGLFTARAVLALGLAVFLGGWLLALATLAGVYRRASKRGAHETLLLSALALGALGLGVFLYGVVTREMYAFVLAREIGLWGFLVPLLLTVSHRVIPFFTQSALPLASVPRPAWSLGWLVGGSFLHGLFELLRMPAARLPVALALAGLAFYHTVAWGLRRSFAKRLLAMLHLAFAWFGIAMALYAVQAGLAVAGVSALGRAPLHALGIGFMTGTLIAMATRVTLGHSGQALAVKAPTWFLFLGLNAVALMRVAAEVAPGDAYQTLNLLAAAGWLAGLIPWAARYAPVYLRARADGQPG